jgi:hypothetical protein
MAGRNKRAVQQPSRLILSSMPQPLIARADEVIHEEPLFLLFFNRYGRRVAHTG